MALARHAGAARFAFNQCLAMVKTGINQRKSSLEVEIPWTGFDLINAFNTWKRSEDAGRVLAVDPDGVAQVVVTGLSWRREVCQEVFEEAAVDLAKGLRAWSESRSGARRGKRVGFPKFKKKTSSVSSFRLRNRHRAGRRPPIRIGDGNRPRSVTLPGIGQIRVHDDTRRLRRMLGKGRAKILFATVSHRAGRWWVSLNVEAAELNSAARHQPRDPTDNHGWVGVDLGLSAYVVAATADGREVSRITDAPKALAAGLRKQERLAKSLARKQKGSNNRRAAAAKLRRHHEHVANVRRHFLHQVSSALAKTHDRLVIEDLYVRGMLANHRLARAIADASWGEFRRQLQYKEAWRGGEVVVADRWFPSSRLCRACGTVRGDLTLADRVFTCGCGYSADRDCNAAANLARWGQDHCDSSRTPDPRAAGRAINARRRSCVNPRPKCAGENRSDDAGTDVHTKSPA